MNMHRPAGIGLLGSGPRRLAVLRGSFLRGCVVSSASLRPRRLLKARLRHINCKKRDECGGTNVLGAMVLGVIVERARDVEARVGEIM